MPVVRTAQLCINFPQLSAVNKEAYEEDQRAKEQEEGGKGEAPDKEGDVQCQAKVSQQGVPLLEEEVTALAFAEEELRKNEAAGESL